MEKVGEFSTGHLYYKSFPPFRVSFPQVFHRVFHRKRRVFHRQILLNYSSKSFVTILRMLILGDRIMQKLHRQRRPSEGRKSCSTFTCNTNVVFRKCSTRSCRLNLTNKKPDLHADDLVERIIEVVGVNLGLIWAFAGQINAIAQLPQGLPQRGVSVA